MYEKRFYEPQKHEFADRLRQLLGNTVNATADALTYKEYFNRITVSMDASVHVSQSAILMITYSFSRTMQDMSGYEPEDIVMAFATDSLVNSAPNITFGEALSRLIDAISLNSSITEQMAMTKAVIIGLDFAQKAA